MRYIGSKSLLLNHIKQVILENIQEPTEIFCDIFSGTSAVARFFKPNYKIISNDLLHFSYALQFATIENNNQPEFKKLKDIQINDPIDYFNSKDAKLSDLLDPPFIFNNYSPNNDTQRQYFTNDNALQIDFIRQTIEYWRNQELIDNNEYYYLIATLIEAIPFVSNIAGTYGAYLKYWDNRAYKKITLQHFEVADNKKDNRCFNYDSNELIKKIKGDILYIDPPYNSRQYLPNYHILETISKYDNPRIYCKTGLRPYKDVKSKYCVKNKVYSELNNLIQFAKFKYLVVSYNSEGLLDKDEIKDVLFKHGVSKTYKLTKIPYRRYKHIKRKVKHDLKEFIFFIQKQ